MINNNEFIVDTLEIEEKVKEEMQHWRNEVISSLQRKFQIALYQNDWFLRDLDGENPPEETEFGVPYNFRRNKYSDIIEKKLREINCEIPLYIPRKFSESSLKFLNSIDYINNRSKFNYNYAENYHYDTNKKDVNISLYNPIWNDGYEKYYQSSTGEEYDLELDDAEFNFEREYFHEDYDDYDIEKINRIDTNYDKEEDDDEFGYNNDRHQLASNIIFGRKQEFNKFFEGISDVQRNIEFNESGDIVHLGIHGISHENILNCSIIVPDTVRSIDIDIFTPVDIVKHWLEFINQVENVRFFGVLTHLHGKEDDLIYYIQNGFENFQKVLELIENRSDLFKTTSCLTWDLSYIECLLWVSNRKSVLDEGRALIEKGLEKTLLVFGKINRLERLTIIKTSKIPETISLLTKLKILDASGGKIKYLPGSFGNLVNLERINLKKNKLENLPESFGNLINLETLNLEENELESLSESFGNLKNLRSFKLSIKKGEFNKELTLPVSFGNLKNLQVLKIDAPNLQSLPDSFGNLIGLKHLNMTCRGLTALPDSFGNLISLMHLYIICDGLTALPDSFGNLKKLQNLELYVPKLQSLPASFGKLINLEELKLIALKLNDFSNSIKNMLNLQRLILSRNQFLTLPKNIEKFTNLQELDLSNNKLQSIPINIIEFLSSELIILS
jgi:hypothetical protein